MIARSLAPASGASTIAAWALHRRISGSLALVSLPRQRVRLTSIGVVLRSSRTQPSVAARLTTGIAPLPRRTPTRGSKPTNLRSPSRTR